MTKKEKAKDRVTEVMIGVAASTLLILSVFAIAWACLAPPTAFSAPADVATSETQWGDVVPTNTVKSVVADAGFATRSYVDKVAGDALFALTNDFAANTLPAEAVQPVPYVSCDTIQAEAVQPVPAVPPAAWYDRVEADEGSRAYWVLVSARERAGRGEDVSWLRVVFADTLARWMAKE